MPPQPFFFPEDCEGIRGEPIRVDGVKAPRRDHLKRVFQFFTVRVLASYGTEGQMMRQSQYIMS